MWQSIVQLLVSFATGIAGAWLATIQFRSQSVWKQKNDAYTEIFDTLSVLQRVSNIWLNAEYTQRFPSEDRAAELREEWKEARVKLHRFCVLGAFVTSPDAEAVLVKLRTELEKEYDSAFERCDSDSYETRIAITELKRIALHERSLVLGAWFRKPKWLNLTAGESRRLSEKEHVEKIEEIPRD